MKKNILYSMLFAGVILLNGCMADMRTPLIKNEGITSGNVAKGKAILESAWKKHGFENLDKHKTYGFNAIDTWRGLMGRMGKPWPEAKSNVSFKFEVGTFNSQITFLDGKREGVSAGLQNWKYYEIEPGKGAEFIDVNKKINFALPAYHYFFEMVDRLKTASIISYAGEKEFRGETYDLIICTWGSAEPHMEDDQYIAWINQKTGMMEYSEYTLRDNYLKVPGYKAFYGAIEMNDFRDIEGVMVPHEQIVYLNGVKKKSKRHVHKLKVTDFKFDGFDVKDLYPHSTDQTSGANIK